MNTLLLLSSILGMSSSHWVVVWAMMEVNTLAMCFLVTKEFKEMKKKTESSLSYYMVQISASSLLLWAMSMNDSKISMMMMMISMMMKMGVWPLHMWFMWMINSMELSMKTTILLTTWQKILPLVMMPSLAKDNKFMMMMLMMMTMASATSPMSKLSNTMSMKSIIGLSSLYNNSWMMVALIISTKVLFIFLVFYSGSMTILLLHLKKLKKKTLKSKNENFLSIMAICNMGGMPPMSMFWTKLMILKKSTETKVPPMYLTLMMIMACILLYFYLKSTMKEMVNYPTKEQMTSNKKTTKKTMMLILMSSLSAYTMVLGYIMESLSW